MVEVEAVAKKWGNSIAVVIPKEVVEEEHIKIKDKVTLNVNKAHTAREILGLIPAKRWKRSTQELKDEARKGWE